MTRKSKKYQLLVSALLLCFLQVAGIDVYAQSTVTPAWKDTTIIQREAPKARARRHRDPIIQDSVKKDSIQIIWVVGEEWSGIYRAGIFLLPAVSVALSSAGLYFSVPAER